MEGYFQHVAGFLPKALVFICAIGIFLIICISHFLLNWIRELVKLPWMREENQKARQKILERSRKS